MKEKANNQYIPFGPEWEKEMMKFPKSALIDMIRKEWQSKDRVPTVREVMNHEPDKTKQR